MNLTELCLRPKTIASLKDGDLVRVLAYTSYVEGYVEFGSAIAPIGTIFVICGSSSKNCEGLVINSDCVSCPIKYRELSLSLLGDEEHEESPCYYILGSVNGIPLI